MNRRAFGGLLTTGLVLASCASPPTQYYRIIPVPGAVPGGAMPAGAGLTVSVRGIALPAYLDKDQIITGSASAYQLTLNNNTLWAAPLDQMLQAVLVENLAQRLPNATVTASNGAIGAAANFLIEVDVLRFDPGASGAIDLLAQAAVKSPGGNAPPLTHKITAQAAPATNDAAGTAAAMSGLWAGLADQLAQVLVEKAAAF